MAKYNDMSPEGRSVRLLRVGEQVRHILSELLVRGEVHDELISATSISVNEVRMSPDLRHATVYVKPLLGANEDDIMRAMRSHTAFFQREVAKRTQMKYAAKLKFLPDETFETVDHIESLLADPKVQQDLHKE